jgi:putative SOS response-associated peptidase YedK
MGAVCGRYVSARSEPDLIGAYGVAAVEAADAIVPRWNVAPTDVVPMVRATPDGRRVLASARWGLVPSWASDRTGAARLINARIETVAGKPAFRAAVRLRRCLLPADGYYEWAPDADGRRRPHFVRAVTGTIAFAGLYETWRDPDGGALTTVTVLTTAATGAAATVHDRMPVMLPAPAWSAWLAPDVTDADQALGVIAGSPAPDVVVAPASRRVGDVANDGPQLLVPEPDDLAAPTLF